MNNFFKNIFKKKKKRLVIVISLRNVKIAAAILILLIIFGLVQAAAFDMNLDCDKQSHTCTISKKSTFSKDIITLKRFSTVKLYDISVEPRKTDKNRKVYDILINFGPEIPPAFMGYAFDNPIKANTARVKLSKYIETALPEVHITKRCYFNEYFCF